MEVMSSGFNWNTEKDDESDLDTELDGKDDVPLALTYDLDIDPTSPGEKQLHF